MSIYTHICILTILLYIAIFIISVSRYNFAPNRTCNRNSGYSCAVRGAAASRWCVRMLQQGSTGSKEEWKLRGEIPWLTLGFAFSDFIRLMSLMSPRLAGCLMSQLIDDPTQTDEAALLPPPGIRLWWVLSIWNYSITIQTMSATDLRWNIRKKHDWL